MKYQLAVILLFLSISASGSCLKDETLQTNCGVASGMSGLKIIDTWTWGGVGHIFLRRNNWSNYNNWICYKTSKRCYFFDANMCYRQPGDTLCGRRIQLNTQLYDGGVIWLAGNKRGGVLVEITSSELPGIRGVFSSYRTSLNLGWSPLGWSPYD